MNYFMALALAVGFGVPVAVLSAALGQGKAASAALEGMARQPELVSQLQTVMILAFAFIESLVIFALLVFFLLSGKLPDTAKVMELEQQKVSAAAPRAGG
ncbi:MAG TPA: ATP synthase F0 subunit C [Chthonomonadaceae bacterium]|nr:ATP synthase F0 subunit C [Chthonomonadaceae bacterium]